MADIDLLVAPGDAVRAYELLQAAGFARTRPFEHGLEETLAHDKHLPQLTSSNGTVFELHCGPGLAPTRARATSSPGRGGSGTTRFAIPQRTTCSRTS
jgi:hypothetical protein